MIRSVKSCLAFTLVELLVVIGIIALLVGILLPALSSARNLAYTVKCSSNLRSVGQGIAIYVAQYQAFPAAYTYKGQKIVSGVQTPAQADDGYIHWSSFLYSKPGADQNGPTNQSAYGNGIYNDATGWGIFQCPSIVGGGLPPTNTTAGNLDGGQANDDGATVVDYQSPRMAYTLNEAICPRNKFVVGFGSPPSARSYQYVKAAKIRNSAGTILGTEWNQDWHIVSSAARAGSGFACKSHRPVHAFEPIGGTTDDGTGSCQLNMDQVAPNFRGLPVIERVPVTALDDDPSSKTASAPATGFRTRLDWVGRNHGRKPSGKDTRQTNFLYVDGHVETKSIYATFTPWEWGEQFYSLFPNTDVVNR